MGRFMEKIRWRKDKLKYKRKCIYILSSEDYSTEAKSVTGFEKRYRKLAKIRLNKKAPYLWSDVICFENFHGQSRPVHIISYVLYDNQIKDMDFSNLRRIRGVKPVHTKQYIHGRNEKVRVFIPMKTEIPFNGRVVVYHIILHNDKGFPYFSTR